MVIKPSEFEIIVIDIEFLFNDELEATIYSVGHSVPSIFKKGSRVAFCGDEDMVTSINGIEIAILCESEVLLISD